MREITETNYVDHAERVIESMIIKDKTGRGRDKINLTTSKIRNLLSMVNNLQALIKQEKEPVFHFYCTISHVVIELLYDHSQNNWFLYR